MTKLIRQQVLELTNDNRNNITTICDHVAVMQQLSERTKQLDKFLNRLNTRGVETNNPV
jgi:hypothetical protein